MNIQKLIQLPFRYKPWKPKHLSLITKDIFSLSSQPVQDHKSHLSACIDWLCTAQDIRMGKADNGSVSAGWSFEDGWLPGYPETTGYIIETFLAAAKILDRKDLIERANHMIDWELSLQQEDGAFPGHFGEPGSHPVIFNTGQIMHGMNAGYLQLQREDCLNAAVKAGHWLKAQQDQDGCWYKFEHNGVPHVYNTRGTWALLVTALMSGDKTLKQSAINNLDWALTQQLDNGWYQNNAFTADRPPFTHTIAYAIRGFLECGILLQETRYTGSALKAAQAVAKCLTDDGWLAGTLDSNWQSQAKYSCLTGIAQMSLNWTRLAQDCNVPELHEPARKALEYLKRNHNITSNNPVIKGAIAGSAPIWGDYSRFEFPNWAAKFFADAIMMDMTGNSVPPIAIIPSPSGKGSG